MKKNLDSLLMIVEQYEKADIRLFQEYVTHYDMKMLVWSIYQALKEEDAYKESI